ncbi:MAG: porin family protein [Prevotella sp.]|jgi:outer membrane protein X|nr:porin family protein [Prevotella sp.]MBQ2193336.1 porin family protein [Prevotella sp.]
MKKLFLTMFVALVSMSAMAQDGKYAIGVNLLYGTKIENIGIGVKGQYYATDNIRAEVAADYFMEKNDLKMWDVNLNAHYLIPTGSSMCAYPLVGIGITDWNSGLFSDKVKIAINLGAGYQINLTDVFSINVEGKYQIIDSYNQGVFSVGAAYRF